MSPAAATKSNKQSLTAKTSNKPAALKVAAKSGLRSATAYQPTKGFSYSGKSKSLLADIPVARHGALEAAYRKVVSIIEKLTDDEAAAVCCAAVAQHDWETITEASQNKAIWYRSKRLSKREESYFSLMADSMDSEQLEQFKTAFLAAKKSAKNVDSEASA